MEQKYIYIILSQTGTILSRIVHVFTKDKYNHASISLDKPLEHMYSFGRLNPYNPFVGGFVKESPAYGTFKRFYNTDCVVIEVPVDSQKHQELMTTMQEMYGRKKDYSYNYKGLFLASFDKPRRKIGRFYCSEFVYEFCYNFGIKVNKAGNVIKPMDLYNIPNGKIIFEGKLQEYYRLQQKQKTV